MSTISITLDSAWDPIVRVGSKLTHTSPIAQLTTGTSYPQTIPLSRILGFNPSKIFSHIKKGVGTLIKKGDVIAEKRSLFGSKSYTADADGMITHIDHVLGEICYEQVLPDESSAAIMSLIEGTVRTIEKDHIDVSVSKVFELEIETETTDRLGGPVLITNAATSIILTQPQVASAIIISDALNEYTISKCEALQAQAFVTTDKIYSSIRSFTLKKPQTYTELVDFAPKNVYANETSKILYFYQ